MSLNIKPIAIKGPWSSGWALNLHTVWDGVSNGTLNNILNLLARGKKVVVYFSPARESRTLRQIADVIPLLEHCPKAAMDEFESKIELAARIAQPQARLNLVCFQCKSSFNVCYLGPTSPHSLVT
jgi:hypothetical protein